MIRLLALGLLAATCSTPPQVDLGAPAEPPATAAPGAPPSARAASASAATALDATVAAASSAPDPDACPPEAACRGSVLVTCRAWRSVSERCPRGCQPMPRGVGPRCARDVEPPAAVLATLDKTPYVEDRCEPASGGERTCRYSMLGLDATVVTRTPDAAVVARWIVDASSYAAPIDALFDVDRAAWEAALSLVARHVRNQSSRIFPVRGDVVEQLGSDAPRAFRFDRGVVTPCEGGGCACRINSLRPGALCRYREAMGLEAGDACRARLGGPSGDGAWRAQCQSNHAAALDRSHNEHFRAAAFDLGRRIEERCPGGCPAPRVLEVTSALLGARR